MKNTILMTVLMVCLSGIMYAQSSTSSIDVGDSFIIGEANNYKYINFPRANLIIKKGGIANYKNIKGVKVEITSIKEEKNGKLVATIRLKSKKNFFNSHKFITVDIVEAINNKELLKI